MTKKLKENQNQEDVNEQLFFVNGSDIYFGGPVNCESMLWFKKAFDNAIHDSKLSNGLVNIFISSDGGEVVYALGIIDTILNPVYKGHYVRSVIMGQAASAATLIACACHYRSITENSTMLIHGISTGCKGKITYMSDNGKHADMLQDKMLDIYFKNSNLSKKAINNIFNRELWINAESALKYGLVDDIDHNIILVRNNNKKIKRINKVDELDG